MIQDAWHSSLEQSTLPTDLKITWSQRQISAANRGIQKRLEQAGQSLMKGYHTVLTSESFEAITTTLDQLDSELRGFAYEGVGMGLAQQDFLARRSKNSVPVLANSSATAYINMLHKEGLIESKAPSHSQNSDSAENQISAFTNGPGIAYKNMVYVGLGLMLARLKRPIVDEVSRLSEQTSWLVLDGYGYYQGMFHWQDALDRQVTPLDDSSYLQQVFDQGLGRSIWFVDGGDAAHIARTVGSFTPARQADLWGGVGYACAYAGGVEHSAIENLGRQSGPYLTHLSQGIALAAYSRRQLGNQSPYTEMACQVIWGKQADDVAACQQDNITLQATQEKSSIAPSLSRTEGWQHYRARLL
jgi:enediyne biosynthesis protein E3